VTRIQNISENGFIHFATNYLKEKNVNNF